MKRQVQDTGVRKYFGGDLIELQEEPLMALDAFFAECGPCIIEGCSVEKNAAGTYDVAAGMVALEAEDTTGGRRVMVMPFDGAANVAMPLYLSASKQAIVRTYGDGKSKPVAYDYRAVASGVSPEAGVSHLKLIATGGVRFTDALQDSSHRFITDAERSTWNAKETTGGSQVKATKALTDAKAYADSLKTDTDGALAGHVADTVKHVTAAERSKWNAKETTGGSQVKATKALTDAKAYADSLKTNTDGALAGHVADTVKHITAAERSTWNAKASTATATTTTAGLMSAADKSKLDGVQSGAQVYVHPSTHPASMITPDSTHRFVTDSEKSVWNAKETPSGSQAKASAAEETAVRDSNLRRQLTGAVMGKGLFKSFDSILLPKNQPHSTLLVFTTPKTRTASGSLTLYNEGVAGNVGYGFYVTYQYTGKIAVYMRGTLLISEAVPVNTLCCAGISYDGTARCIAMLNGKTVLKEDGEYAYGHNPSAFLLGGTEASDTAKTLPQYKMIACRRFNFPMSEAQLTDAWNGGHPEFWRVPDSLRNTKPSLWPTASFTQSKDTWKGNAVSMTTQTNIAASNGFSGPFQRWTNGTDTRVSVYNQWRLNNKTTDLNRYQLIEFEYRSDAPLRAAMGNKSYGEWKANTGNAAKGSYVAPAGEYTNLELIGTTGTFLEVRTLRIVTWECLLDLVPAGLFPTRWNDLSGKGREIPYIPSEGNPDEIELSNETVGYPPTTGSDREELLDYANRYASQREELLLSLHEARLKEYTDERTAVKQDTIPNVVITDFDAFRPSGVPEIAALKDGEFACFTSYNAAGRPADIGSYPGSSILTGRITRLRARYYRLEAMCGVSYLSNPQCYTRLYFDNQPEDWQAGTELLNSGTNGFVKFSSGLMIQWGKSSPATRPETATVNIDFPQPFASTPLSMNFSAVDAIAGPRIWSFPIRSLTAKKVTVDQFLIDNSGISASGCLFFWTAIGTWK